MINQKALMMLLAAVLSTGLAFGQAGSLYVPVTTNTPLFNPDETWQAAIQFNNFGFNYSLAAQKDQKVVFASVQHSDGRLRFDPLTLVNVDPGFSEQLIEIDASPTFYSELGLGYHFGLPYSQKLGLYAGFGRGFVRDMSRLFMQVDWGNEGKLANFGVSLRGNYARVNEVNMFILEPRIVAKFKYKKLRLLTQFGYSIPTNEGQDFTRAILSVGIGYVQ